MKGEKKKLQNACLLCQELWREPQLTAMGGAGDRQCWGQHRNLLPLHFFLSIQRYDLLYSDLCSVDSLSLKPGKVLKEIKLL